MKLSEFQKRVLVNGERADIDESTPEGLAELIRKCWAQDPKERPTFYQIFVFLCIFILAQRKNTSVTCSHYFTSFAFRTPSAAVVKSSTVFSRHAVSVG